MILLSKLLIATALIGAGEACASPIVRSTVFGDLPGLEYEPRFDAYATAADQSEDARKALDASLAEASAKTGSVASSTVQASARRPVATQPPGQHTQILRSGAVPRAVIPGMNEGMAVGGAETPLVPLGNMSAIDDLRFMDEADEAAQRERLSGKDDQVVAEASAEAVATSRAEAVKEAVRSARDVQQDESVQSEIKAVLDEETELVEFKLVEIGDMDKVGDNGDGVLGLVRVIKAGGEDEFVINEEGQVLVTEKGGEQNQIMRWSAADVQIDPAKAGAGAIAPEAFTALGEASLVMVGRLGTSGGETGGNRGIGSDIFSQGLGAYSGLLDPSVLANRSDGSNKNRVPVQLTFSQFLAILRGLLFQTQTIVVVIAAFVVSFGLYRVIRRRG